MQRVRGMEKPPVRILGLTGDTQCLGVALESSEGWGAVKKVKRFNTEVTEERRR